MSEENLETQRGNLNPPGAGPAPEPREDALRALAAELRRGHPVSVIYSDLDNFKSVNDKFGHSAGDACVEKFKQIATEVAQGKGEVFRRYATGDEFVVILPNFTTAEGAAVAERIRRAVETTGIGRDIAVTASLGVHGSDVGPVTEAEKLLQLADQMMYRAKQTKNTVAAPAILAGVVRPAELTRSLDQWMRDSSARWETLARDRISGENRALYYAWGAWSIAYAIGAIPSSRLSLPELLETLEKMPGQTRCLRPWRVPSAPNKRPYPFGRAIECWPTASPDGFSPEFWRASPELKMFYLRKHEEDELPGAGHVLPASRRLVIHRPIWRVGECVLHAARLCHYLNLPSGPVAFCARWTGLTGRRLAGKSGGPLDPHHECQQDSVESSTTATTANLEEKVHEVTGALLAPLYEAFNLFRVEEGSLRSETANMLTDCSGTK